MPHAKKAMKKSMRKTKPKMKRKLKSTALRSKSAARGLVRARKASKSSRPGYKSQAKKTRAKAKRAPKSAWDTVSKVARDATKTVRQAYLRAA